MIKYAQIEPTTRCNFTCGFCAGRSMPQGDLSWEAFERFLAANPGLEYVELQGEGEPLMHPRFFDMVAACRERGIRVSLITNGSMLVRDKVDRLISEGVEAVHVSLESADADEFQDIRGGKFSKVVSGLGLLMQRRAELGKDRPAVGFSVTVLRRTLGSFNEIVRLYKELNLDGGIGVQLLQNMPVYKEKYDHEMLEQLVPPEIWQRHSSMFDAALALLPVRSDLKTYYGALFADLDVPSGKCPWLEQGAYVTIDGSVTGCCFMKKPEHAFGNMLIDPPSLIARRRRALARKLKQGVIPAPCEGCNLAHALTQAKAASPYERGQ
jgi:MoaA/NifB/PqqE/SkfB family radical SAM enzyme